MTVSASVNRLHWFLLATVALSVLPGVPTDLVAQDRLQLEMGKLAEQIATVVRGQKETSIAIGQFTGPTALQASAGPGIALTLEDELKKLEIQVNRRSRLQVEGKYSPVCDSKEVAVRIEGQVLERSGDVAGTFKVVSTLTPRGIKGPTGVGRVFGATFAVSPAWTPEREYEVIAPLIDDMPDPNRTPTRPNIDSDHGTVLRPAVNSPFGLEVQVLKGTKYQPLPLADLDGLAFVKLARDDIYAIRVINDAPHDVAVSMTIDGVNMFRFSEHKDYSFVLVGNQKAGLVKGWHRTNSVSDSFQIAEYSKSAAAETLRNDANVGTITAIFKAAWPTTSSPPSDEGVSPKEALASRSVDATARGPETNAKYEEVDRIVGKFRSAISIRYSTRN